LELTPICVVVFDAGRHLVTAEREGGASLLRIATLIRNSVAVLNEGRILARMNAD